MNSRIFLIAGICLMPFTAHAALERLDIGRDVSPGEVTPVILTPITPPGKVVRLEVVKPEDQPPKATDPANASPEPIHLEINLQEVGGPVKATKAKKPVTKKQRKFLGAIVPKGAKIKSAPAVKKHVQRLHEEPRPAIVEQQQEVSTAAEQRAVEKAIEQATQNAALAKKNRAGTVYAFKDNAIYNVYAKIGNVTTIILQAGEKLVNVAAGDTERWQVDSTTSGEGDKERTHVLLKPMEEGIETNFIVTTSKRFYTLNVKCLKTFFQPIISWTYPNEERLIALRAKEEQQRLDDQVTAPALQAEALNFNYVIKGGNILWKPYRVFDDGQKTYIQMSDRMKVAEAPVFFIKNGDSLDLVNYRVVNDYYIVDRLFGEATLKSGEQAVSIRNKVLAPSWFD